MTDPRQKDFDERHTKVPESKTKTFQHGDDYGELIEWVMKQIETHEYQPEGTSSYGDNLAPFDPVCELVGKYRITITKILPQTP